MASKIMLNLPKMYTSWPPEPMSILGYLAMEIKDADEINFDNQLTWNWRDYSGLFRWAQSYLDKLEGSKKWILPESLLKEHGPADTLIVVHLDLFNGVETIRYSYTKFKFFT